MAWPSPGEAALLGQLARLRKGQIRAIDKRPTGGVEHQQQPRAALGPDDRGER